MINNTILHYFEKVMHLPLFNGFECATIDLRYFVIIEKFCYYNYVSFAVSTRLLSNVKYDNAVLKICKNIKINILIIQERKFTF